MEPLLTGAQIRMARGLLKWSAQELANRAGVGVMTVKRLEKVNGLAKSVHITRNESVRDAFLNTGLVRFKPNACISLDETE